MRVFAGLPRCCSIFAGTGRGSSCPFEAAIVGGTRPSGRGTKSRLRRKSLRPRQRGNLRLDELTRISPRIHLEPLLVTEEFPRAGSARSVRRRGRCHRAEEQPLAQDLHGHVHLEVGWTLGGFAGADAPLGGCGGVVVRARAGVEPGGFCRLGRDDLDLSPCVQGCSGSKSEGWQAMTFFGWNYGFATPISAGRGPSYRHEHPMRMDQMARDAS